MTQAYANVSATVAIHDAPLLQGDERLAADWPQSHSTDSAQQPQLEDRRTNDAFRLFKQDITSIDPHLSPCVRRKPLPSSSLFYQGSQHINDTTTIQSVKNVSLLSTWLFELLSCVLVVLALVAIIITLLHFEGKPLPQWPHNITINSVIAIYSVILRAAAGSVLSQSIGQLKWKWFQKYRCLQDISSYDESTRGPWGSLRLLYHLQGRQISACLRALITVAALFIDPFTQQVIMPYSCNWPDFSSNASLPRTSVHYGHGSHTGAGIESIDPGTQAAIYNGLFAQTATQVKYDCPSGNCTYDAFNTIGYYHACYEITAELIIDRDFTTRKIYDVNGQAQEFIVSLTTFRLPGVAAPLASINSTQVSSLMIGTTIYSGATILLVPAQQYSGPLDRPAYLTRFHIDETAKAFSCTMNPCVRTINASVQRGILYEHTVATHPFFGNTSYDNGSPPLHVELDWNITNSLVDLVCLTKEQRLLWLSCGYKFGSNDTFISSNISKAVNGTLETYTAMSCPDLLVQTPPQCVYTVAINSVFNMASFVSKILAGSLFMPEEVYIKHPDGPGSLLYLYSQGPNLDGFNTAMARIADSLTSHVRQTEPQVNDVSTPVDGLSQITTTCISVKWAWLVYTTSIVVGIIIFLVATIIHTGTGSERCRFDFKSSELAIMCTGLADEAQVHLKTTISHGNQNELEKASKHMKVRFVSSIGRFVKQE